MEKTDLNQDYDGGATVYEQWWYLCPNRTINQHRIIGVLSISSLRLDNRNVTCILNNYPSSQFQFVLRERQRELLVFTRLRVWNLYQCAMYIIRLLGWNQQKGSGRRFYLISFSSLHVLKCSCPKQPWVHDQFTGTTSIGRFCFCCLNTKRMQRHPPVIL